MARKEVVRAEKPDPEVKPTGKQRRFSRAEKLRILEEADACTERGEIGALVRREGIYRSYLSRWRRARAEGKLNGSQAQKRGPKTRGAKELAQEVAKLRQENERLQTQLKQAETIIEVQKNSPNCLVWRRRCRRASRQNDRSGRSAGKRSGGIRSVPCPGNALAELVSRAKDEAGSTAPPHAGAGVER